MKNHLSVFLKSKDVRRLIENFFSLSILKLFNIILPFVTLPYLIKVLGFQKYGAIVLALSLIAYFQAITDYGFNLSATREITRHQYSNKKLSYIYSQTIISKIILLIFSLFILIALISSIQKFRDDYLVYLLMFLPFIGQTIFPEWFFRGIEKMRYITILDLTTKLSFTIGVFLLIKEPKDYWLYPLLYGCSFLIISFVSHALILRKYKINIYFISLNKIFKNLKNKFSLFLNQFMPNFYNNTTVFLVGVLLGNTSVGIFGAIRQVVNILSVLNNVISTVFFPYLVRKKEKFYLISKFYAVGFLSLTLFLVVINPFVLRWLGILNNHASLIFSIMAFGTFFIAIYSLYATNYLIPRGCDKIVAKNTVIISLIGLCLAYPCIKAFGIVGGAINIALSQLMMGLTAYIYYVKFKKVFEKS